MKSLPSLIFITTIFGAKSKSTTQARRHRLIYMLWLFPVKDVTAFLAVFARTQHIAATFGANFNPPLLQTIIAKRLFERRAKKARLLRLFVQIGTLGICVMVDRGSAFLTHVPLVRVVTPANRTFDRIVNLGLLMTPVAPNAACSTIGHTERTSAEIRSPH